VIDFKLPELGENVAAGDVLTILVKAGDTIAKDQAVLELETDKATIEVPSSVAGKVTEVKVKVGDKVKTGQVILSLEEDGAGAAAAAAPKAKEAKAAPAPRKDDAEASEAPPPADDRKSEPTPDQAAARGEADVQPDAQAEESSDSAGRFRAPAPDKVVDINRGGRGAAASSPQEPAAPSAPAAPSVRRMARELGVEINDVSGTGPSGRISVDDVKAHAKQLITAAPAVAQAQGLVFEEPLPDFTRWGEIDVQPLRSVRRKTAVHLSVAWRTIPHVTQHDSADITNLESIRKNYSKQAEAAGGALTVTAVAVKIVATALKVFPQFNSSIDLANDQMIAKKYINIGVAVDTDRGLLVPVIRNADRKNMLQIAAELAQLSEKARSRKISLEEMQGGCFSVSNLGGLGGTSFTPIINAPEVAILGISRGKYQPVYHKETGSFVPRFLLPLSLSYDHRVIDGADGVRFLRWVVDAFEQPFLMALQG
jgi:pyruvate dehydrogenase E2 component (dihydrolipoamide acetyltransferase)